MYDSYKINRRCFLELASAASARFLFWGGPKKAIAEAWEERHGDQQVESLRGFIVSDAHFGWVNEQQPSVKEQAEMMERIVKKFPSLDCFIDTGDGFHNDASKDDIRDWSDTIAGGCGTFPFYYVTGNHEIASGEYEYPSDLKGDPEWRVNNLGSFHCRPYYSFNIKGIHFVSLPELIMMSYISEETLEWLKLDLKVNKDMTTVILSHNSLEGTTDKFEDTGYRRIANSGEVFEIFEKNPQIVAWMHGHNHNYDLITRKNMMYVSNGRIGGFNPEKDDPAVDDNLGGIFFEIKKDKFEVRAFNASEDKFFDETEGHEELSKSLNITTSFDKESPFEVCYGKGGAYDGEMIPVWHHHAGKSLERKLYMAGSKKVVINENSDLSVFTQRVNENWQTKHLPGFSFEPGEENEKKIDESWKWLNPGVKIKADGDESYEKTMYAPGKRVSHRSYYSCVAGKKYKVRVTGEFPEGANLRFLCEVRDRTNTRLVNLESSVMELNKDKPVTEHVFSIPELELSEIIYNDCRTDNILNMAVGAKFSNFKEDVIIKKFEIFLAESEDKTVNPGVYFDKELYGYSGALSDKETVSFKLPSSNDKRSVLRIKAEGSGTLNWLVKETKVQWQVRNAPAVLLGDYLEVGKLRNDLTEKEEVIIAPTMPVEHPYVHRLRHIQGAIISLARGNKEKISVGVKNITGNGVAEIEVFTKRKPEKVINSSKWWYKNGILVIRVVRRGGIKIIF